MDEELKFQKLSEVELLEEAPKNAYPLVETDGMIKRVKDNLGGSGACVLDVSDKVAAFLLVDFTGGELPEGMHYHEPMLEWQMPYEDVKLLIDTLAKSGSVIIRLDSEKCDKYFVDAGITSGPFSAMRGKLDVSVPIIIAGCHNEELPNDEVMEQYSAFGTDHFYMERYGMGVPMFRVTGENVSDSGYAGVHMALFDILSGIT